MKTGKNLKLQIQQVKIEYDYIHKRVEGHNRRFAGVPGKKATVEMYKEYFLEDVLMRILVLKKKVIGFISFERLRDFRKCFEKWLSLVNKLMLSQMKTMIYYQKGSFTRHYYQTYHHIKYDFFTDKLYYDEFREKIARK